MSRQRMSEARRNVPSCAFELRKWRGPRHLLSLRGGEADQVIVRVHSRVSWVSPRYFDPPTETAIR
ncbi:MAG: hypothetical protein ACJATR_001215 [Halopseudomonas sp.]|jgi:hypothetical protein